MNAKLIEGAMGMLARLIPPEEYAKATKSLNELAALLRSIDDRMADIQKNCALIPGLVARIELLEMAASADSPAFRQAQAEQALWMVPGTIEGALAPSRGDGDGR